eukprot:173773-Amphidinium_carterae.1
MVVESILLLPAANTILHPQTSKVLKHAHTLDISFQIIASRLQPAHMWCVPGGACYFVRNIFFPGSQFSTQVSASKNL